MKLSQQLALLTPPELAVYKRARTIAIINGLVSLFSFWINFGLLYVAMQIAGTYGIYMGKESIIYVLPSAVAAYICFQVAKHQMRKAREIRHTAVDRTRQPESIG
jgi:hypothetical protein